MRRMAERTLTSPMWSLLPLISLTWIAGCGESKQPPVVNAVSIADVVEALGSEQSSEDAAASSVFSVKGVIYAGEHDPFEPTTAAFLMSEVPDPNHGDGSLEHVDSCPFCKRRAEKATKAMVEFRGDDGEVIPTPASELFGLSKGDQVVVTGDCRYDESLNVLIIAAADVNKS